MEVGETLNDCGFKMMMSPAVDQLAAAIAKVQASLAPVVKDAANPFFKSKFATLAACVEAIKPFHDEGIAIIQPPSVSIGGGVSVSTILIHKSGQWIKGELFMPTAKQDPQGYGSALSYARRYCLTATCGLATEDDDGEKAMPRQNVERKITVTDESAENDQRATDALKKARTPADLEACRKRYRQLFDQKKLSDTGLKSLDELFEQMSKKLQ
jgi:hypothetical protein